MALGSIKDIYSQGTQDAEKKLQEIEANKPAAFQSGYTGVIGNLMNQIVNQKPYSYDFNADPLYQQYKDNYTQMGKQAMIDTAANAATLTGGFGNSYATTAAAQANQQYLAQLNNVIPELWGLAMDKYQMETDNLYNQYAAVSNQEDRDYGRYRDTLGDWQSDRGYYYDRYANGVANDQYVSERNYQESRDAVADSQWQQQFDYQKEQDALALARASASNSSGGGSSSGSSSTSSRGGASRESYQEIMNEASTIRRKEGTMSSDDYLAEKVNDGSITEIQADAIMDRIAMSKNKKLKKNANAQVR